MRKHFDFIYPSYEMDVCDEDHVSYSLLLPDKLLWINNSLMYSFICFQSFFSSGFS